MNLANALFISLLAALLSMISLHSLAQIKVSGMVADSLSLSALPDTNIKSKKTGKFIPVDAKGFFNIELDNYDTLLFSRIGYRTLEYPVFFSEEDILILLSEDVKILEEVTVTGYTQPVVKHPESKVPIRTLESAEMFSSPFTYFSRTEKDKRRVLKYRSQQSRIQVYADVVADPQFKQNMMQQFDLDEKAYYDILARFNAANKHVQYMTQEDEIIKHIEAFFESTVTEH
jgi:hypothetical protein